MLSGIKVVDRQADRKHKKKKHRHKDKKHKKEKKSSKIEHHSSTDNSDHHHIDKHHPAPPPPPPPLQREDWMSAAMARPIDAPVYQMKDDNDNDNNQEEDQERKETAQPTSKVVDLAKVPNNNDARNKTTTVGVGDGGASWRLKALQRAKQRTQEEGEGGDGSGGGRGMGQAIQERWGSLSNLLGGQQQQRPAHNLAHLHAARDRKRVEGNNGDGNDDNNNISRSKYLEDVKSARGQMRRPREDFGNRDAHNNSGGGGGYSNSNNNNNKLQVLSWRKKNDDLIKEAAAEMNTFQNDGSFMQQFKTEDKEMGEKNEGKSDSGKVEVEKLATAAMKSEQQQQPQQGRGGDPNKSAAAMLRARLLGKAPPHATTTTTASTLLPIPPPFSNTTAQQHPTLPIPIPSSSRNPPKHNAYEGGERKRYFADDDTTDLHNLMKRTKYEGSVAARGQAAGDMDVAIARGIMKNQRYTTTELDADAEYDHDAGIAQLDNSSGGRVVGKGARKQINRETVEILAKRHETQQWQQHKKIASALDRCQLCFASASRRKHLTLAIGQHTYLALPSKGRLVAGHVLIIPIEHVSSIRKADEAVLTEVRNFKKCLIQMHAATGGKECVFYETATRVEDDTSHAVIECVPLPPAAAARAPLVFRKTVDDASDEWSDHHSKRIIDISRSKKSGGGLQGSIPPNFPYMCVEFGLSEGFVHVIDNERGFNRHLARSVLVGLLGLSEEKGGQQRVRGESEAAQAQWAVEFRKQFDPYDWTKMLS